MDTQPFAQFLESVGTAFLRLAADLRASATLALLPATDSADTPGVVAHPPDLSNLQGLGVNQRKIMEAFHRRGRGTEMTVGQLDHEVDGYFNRANAYDTLKRLTAKEMLEEVDGAIVRRWRLP